MAREFKPSFMDDDQNQMGMVPVSPGTQNSVPTGSGLSAPKTQRKASSGFVNLKNYFNANKNNQLVQKIAQPIEQQISTAQQNLQTSQQQFADQVLNEREKLQNAQSQAQKALGYIDTGAAQPLGIAALPQDATEEQKVKAAVDANKKAAESLTGIRDYNYSGPTEIPQQQKLMQDQFQLDDFAQASKNEAGRGAILQTMFGQGGRYSSGARNLDNFLISTDQDNLQRLRDIRGQTQKFGQELKKFDLNSAAKANALQGNVNVAKDINKTEMQTLRDKVRADLEAEAAGYNTVQKADAAEIDMAELRKYLPELAGYDLVGDPSAVLPPGQVAPTVVDPNTLNYINLYKNKDFEEHQKVDPTRAFTREIKEAGHFGHRDWKHSSTGRPNAQEAIVGLESLKPMFKETYQDNTWESINKDALERRNVLSQVLADNAEKGLVTPQQRQEIQTNIDNDMLSKLKELPGMAEDTYTQSFFTNAPGSGDTGSTIRSYKDLGYTDPVSLMKDMNLNFRVNLPKNVFKVNGGHLPNFGEQVVGGDFTSSLKYNPETKMMNYQVKIPILKKDAKGKLEYQTVNPGPTQRTEPIITGHKYETRSISPEDLTSKITYGKGSFDNNSSPRLIAEKYQQKYLQDKLKEILGQNTQTKIKKV